MRFADSKLAVGNCLIIAFWIVENLKGRSTQVIQGAIHKLRNAIRGGRGKPLHYAMAHIASKIVFLVLQRGQSLNFGQKGVL